MTRARLIEKVIAEWFKQEDVEIFDASPQLLAQPSGYSPRAFSLAALASALDTEFDRIAREAGR